MARISREELVGRLEEGGSPSRQFYCWGKSPTFAMLAGRA